VFIPDVVGKRLRHLIDKGEHLHKLRNKIAHAVIDSGEPIISIDVGADIEEVGKWLPFTKFVARYLLVEAFPDMLKSLSSQPPDKEIRVDHAARAADASGVTTARPTMCPCLKSSYACFTALSG